MTTGNLALNLDGKGGRALALTLGFGMGLGLLHVVYSVTKTEPRALLELIAHWGPVFVLSALVIWLGDRRMGELISLNRENVVAQQRMADAMQAIAHKDDERAREQELLIGELTRNSQTILRHMAEFERRYSTEVGEKLTEIDKWIKGHMRLSDGHSAS